MPSGARASARHGFDYEPSLQLLRVRYTHDGKTATGYIPAARIAWMEFEKEPDAPAAPAPQVAPKANHQK